jgi:hypothetical protein
MGDPFVRLQTSRFWAVMQEDGERLGQEATSPAHLRRVGAVGMLTPLFRSSLRSHPELGPGLVGRLFELLDVPRPTELRGLLGL